MTTILHDYVAGERIPDERDGQYYTYEELDGALFLKDDDITGAETYLLTNGKIVVLYSIDLDWVAPYDDNVLRTVSAPSPVDDTGTK